MTRRTRNIAVALGTAWLAALVLPIGPRYVLERDFAAVLRRASEMGVPRDLAELEAKYPVPPDEANAAPLYARARSIMARFGEESALRRSNAINPSSIGYTASKAYGLPWPAENFRLIEAAVAENEEAVAMLEQAPSYPACRVDVDYDYAMLASNVRNPILPETEHVFLMAMAAIAAFEQGAADAAVRRVEALAAMTRHQAAQPGLGAAYEAYNAVRLTAHVAMWIANRRGVSADHLAALERALASLAEPAAWKAGAETNFISALESVRRDRPAHETGSIRFFSTRVLENFGASDSEAAHTAQKGDIVALNGLLDWIAALDRGDPANAGGDERWVARQRLAVSRGTRSRAVADYTPAWTEFRRAIAWARVAEAVCAIRRARAGGDLPADWRQRMPASPFPGQEMEITVEDNGAVIVGCGEAKDRIAGAALP